MLTNGSTGLIWLCWLPDSSHAHAQKVIFYVNLTQTLYCRGVQHIVCGWQVQIRADLSSKTRFFSRLNMGKVLGITTLWDRTKVFHRWELMHKKTLAYTVRAFVIWLEINFRKEKRAGAWTQTSCSAKFLINFLLFSELQCNNEYKDPLKVFD